MAIAATIDGRRHEAVAHLKGDRFSELLAVSEAAIRSHGSLERVEQIGTALFDWTLRASLEIERIWRIFTAAYDTFGEHEARFVFTCDDEDWSNLPWECLFDGANLGFVALRFHFLRGLHGPMQPVPLHQPADALVAASNPYGDLCLDDEIERCTPHWAILFGNTSLLKDATKQEIVAVLNRQSPAIFHFAGHSALVCRVDETAESWIVVASRGPVETAEAFGADELARHLVSARTRLAVLNSCWSGQLRGGSLLRAFVAAGVANVVAMNQPASDREAIEFAAAFYERLASNGSLEQAVTHARRRVCEHGRSSIAWGLPTAAFNAPALKLLPPFPS